MHVRRVILVLSALILAGLACNAPGSAPVTVVVTVISPPGVASEVAPAGVQPVDQTTATGSAATEASTSSVPMVQATAKVQTAIRKHPGPGCDIIGYVEQGETINLLERTDWEPHWYQTDKLGQLNKGWVYNEPLTLLADDSIIPRVPERGCQYCGDTVCNAAIGETCSTCEADCGKCAVCGDGVVNQSSDQCDGSASSCPVSGSKCNSKCQCVAPKPTCGDGKVNQPSEQCDGSSKGCPSSRYTCSSRCTCVAPIT
jgi:hypothetical protein